MKPDSRTAMRRLIVEIRANFPFDLPQTSVCTGPCRSCAWKLLAFLEDECDSWEQRLDDNQDPGLAGISRLLRSARKIARVLYRDGVMADLPEERKADRVHPLEA